MPDDYVGRVIKILLFIYLFIFFTEFSYIYIYDYNINVLLLLLLLFSFVGQHADNDRRTVLDVGAGRVERGAGVHHEDQTTRFVRPRLGGIVAYRRLFQVHRGRTAVLGLLDKDVRRRRFGPLQSR